MHCLLEPFCAKLQNLGLEPLKLQYLEPSRLRRTEIPKFFKKMAALIKFPLGLGCTPPPQVCQVPDKVEPNQRTTPSLLLKSRHQKNEQQLQISRCFPRNPGYHCTAPSRCPSRSSCPTAHVLLQKAKSLGTRCCSWELGKQNRHSLLR